MERNRYKSDRERFRYGMCLNDECSLCKSKEIQKIPMRKDFVCSECGKELRECPPPKQKSKTPIFIGASIGVLLLIVFGLYFGCNGNSDDEQIVPDSPAKSIDNTDSEKSATTADTVILHDTIVEKDTTTISEKTIIKKEQKSTSTKTASSSGSKTLTLSYGKYTGSTKNGYPHGQGRLTYSTSRQINKNDTKGRTANAGDYVIGEFFNGFVVYGKHYDAAGNLLESLTFGVGSEDSYDAK